MLKLEQISANQMLTGVEPGKIVRIVSVEKLGDHAVNIYYKDSGGRLGERMVFRSDEPSITFADSGCSWKFYASAEDFKSAVEA